MDDGRIGGWMDDDRWMMEGLMDGWMMEGLMGG